MVQDTLNPLFFAMNLPRRSSLRNNFLGAIIRVCHDGVAVAIFVPHRCTVALVGISATVQPVPHHISRGDFVAIHPSLQKVDRSKLFEVFIQAYGVVLYG